MRLPKSTMPLSPRSVKEPSLDTLPNLMRYFYQFLAGKPRLHYWQKKLLHWDTRLCLQVNLLSHQKWVAQFFKGISRLGDGWFWLLALVIVTVEWVWQAQAPHLIMIKVVAVVFTSSCGYGLYKLLKIHTVRPRPYQVHQAITLGERPLDVFSFPSGHTLQAVLWTVMLGYQAPVLLWLLLPFTLLVALSRLVLGLHYPSDVMVGAGIGAAFAFVGNRLSDYMTP